MSLAPPAAQGAARSGDARTPAARLGLFGGSFDPVHCAHVALAAQSLRELRLDEIVWVPAGWPWQKSTDMASASHREAMVRLAIAGEPRFSLSRTELERDGPSYTFDTVAALQAERPNAQWFLLIGEDQQAALPTWYRWSDLLARVTLVVAGRPAAERQAPVPDAQHVLTMPPMEVSSTEIRARLATGRAIDDLVPPTVASYIARHRLYQDLQDPTPPRS
jgi:nicotinate-nucleotide adenylyltransferase